MKKLIAILMIGTFGLVSCGGSQTNDQNTNAPADSPANTNEETGQNPNGTGTMDSDTTSMDTTGTSGGL